MTCCCSAAADFPHAPRFFGPEGQLRAFVEKPDQVAHRRPKTRLTDLIATTMIKTRMKCARKI
jgi:hypothetical protein